MIGIDAVLAPLEGGAWDMQIGPDGDVLTRDSFDTYILVALFTDARASESEVARPERRRGWVGNEYTPGFEMGGKLWLWTEQRRLTRSTINGIQSAAIDALQSMVEEDLAVAVRNARAVVEDDGLSLEVDILRPGSQVEKRHYDLWQNTGA